jgi:hypothetical protein
MRIPEHKSKTFVVSVVWVLMACVAVAPAAEESARPAAIYSFADIQTGVAESRARLRSLQAEFVSTGRDPKTGAMERESIYNKVAALGAKRFHETGHFNVNFSWELDPYRKQIFFTRRMLNVFYPVTRYYETSEKNAQLEYSTKVRQHVLWEGLAWWPPDDDTRPFAGQPLLFLHEVLAQKGARVRPYQEQIDGAWCHVVEVPGLDEFWLDPAIGFGLRFRRWSRGESGTFAVHYELSDYREAGPKIWLPWKIHRVIYDTRSHARGEERPILSDAMVTLLSVRVNDVPEEFFQFTPPPGTLIQNRDTMETTQVPGGRTFLDEVVEYTQRITAMRELESAAAPPPPAGPSLPGYGLIGFILALSGFDLYVLRKAIREFGNTRHAERDSEAACPSIPPSS